ncbi:hypothetical protein ACIQ4I_16735 [Rummeliibacillus sp. NPDC094406]|uniref:hypothetical protein n=1 Tax=Rummeliibacillus sp. NPDC094406 TaxID=3364511 RepID=UPI0038172087
MPKTPENKKSDSKKDKVNNNIKDLLVYIRDSLIGEVIMNFLLIIPRMISKLLKVIFS